MSGDLLLRVEQVDFQGDLHSAMGERNLLAGYLMRAWYDAVSFARVRSGQISTGDYGSDVDGRSALRVVLLDMGFGARLAEVTRVPVGELFNMAGLGAVNDSAPLLPANDAVGQ
ncbi:hypothetical protein [Chitinilyticum aquatile]|uniref:hypothetical protein n=1 Tax=Chitinilyticum aquatile TaxID=362520 RepID=UPI000408CFCB|nr:hypothetical protein [Chitinilyticum aquatile]